MKPLFQYLPYPVLKPEKGCPWADTMILNPAIVKDPETNILHMLFRATGPWPQKRMTGSKWDPYPIFLGYAKSEDNGITWKADFSRPALAPAVEYEEEKLYIVDDEGKTVVNRTNGCIEDPRIFMLEGDLYLTTACRIFPPGPYWLDDLSTRGANMPEWAKSENNPFGKAASTNDTASVLFKLDLSKLKVGDYENAFTYICNLTDPVINDNRDVFLFPEKMMINGEMQYVMLHRPNNPEAFESGKGFTKPSMFLAAARNLKDLAGDKARNKLLAVGIFDWEEERIGASWPPVKISEKEWLLAYHGKKYPGYGYTQSFMILKEKENDFPEIVHRCSERLMYASQDWELPDRFPCPCLFATGGILVDDRLMISYGAADQNVGVAWVDINELVNYLRNFDANGNVNSGLI